MILNESEKRYRNLIQEELGVTDARRLDWMSQMANVHAIVKEGLQPNNMNVAHDIYATPLNTLGAGNPFMPQGLGMHAADGQPNQGVGIGNTGADFHNPAYVNGSGDVPMSTLSMALEVAAVTVGFDLVATVVATGPLSMLTFVDYPYAGGKIGHIGETWQDGKGPGAENKPIYIMLKGDQAASIEFRDNAEIEAGRSVFEIEGDNGTMTGIYMGNSRIDGSVIFQVQEVVDTDDKDTSLAAMFLEPGVFTATCGDVTITFGTAGTEGSGTEGDSDYVAPTEGTNVQLVPELVKGITDHIQSFSNFYGVEVENEDSENGYDLMPSDEIGRAHV